MDLPERLGLDVPVVQAGMGGGLSRAALAGAVSSAGGLGTIGILPAPLLRSEVEQARDIAGDRPVAVNLLMPYVSREHVDVCIATRTPVVTLFCGYDRELVQRLHGSGTFVMQWPAPPSTAQQPVQLLPLPDGRVLAADRAGEVLVYAPDSSLPVFLRPLAVPAGQRRAIGPSGLAPRAGGTMLVTDGPGNRLLVVQRPR